MQVLFTFNGPRKWALLNGLWSVVRDHDYRPERIYLLTLERDIIRAEKFRPMIEELTAAHSFKCQVESIIVPKDDFVMVGRIVMEKAAWERSQGNKVALDITPGRKGMVVSALVPCWDAMDHIFYLNIETHSRAQRPYLCIPQQIQHPHDFVEERK